MLAASLICAFLPLIHGLTLVSPSSWNDSDFNTLQWTPAAGDPSTFAVYLLNNKTMPTGPLDILDSVNTADGSIKFNLPAVPKGPGYQIQAVDSSNTSDILATSGIFSILDTRIPNTTSHSTTGTASSTSSGTQAPNAQPAAPTSSVVFPEGGDGGDSTTGFSGNAAFRSTSIASGSLLSAGLALLALALSA